MKKAIDYGKSALPNVANGIVQTVKEYVDMAKRAAGGDKEAVGEILFDVGMFILPFDEIRFLKGVKFSKISKFEIPLSPSSRVTIGLGLFDDLPAHRGTGAVTWTNGGWQELGLTKVDFGRMYAGDTEAIKAAFRDAATNADAIRFDVSNFDPFPSKPGITNYEFDYINSNPALLQKTTFIQNGVEVMWDGKKFNKKVMNTITNINDCNQVLKEYFGCTVHIWLYQITHRRIILRLSKSSRIEGRHDEIFIGALGCEHITGPFMWKNANISMSKETDQVRIEPLYKIIDREAGFELIASAGAAVMKDVDTEFTI